MIRFLLGFSLLVATLVAPAESRIPSDTVRNWASSASTAIHETLFREFGGGDHLTELISDKLSYTAVTGNGQPLLAGLAAQVQSLLLTYAQRLNLLASTFETTWLVRDSLEDPPSVPDSQVRASLLGPWESSAFFSANVTSNASALLFPPGWSPSASSPDGLKEMDDFVKVSAALDPLMIGGRALPNSQIGYQYFGSRQGLMRFYPGREWVDASAPSLSSYSPNEQAWFVNGASGPKDVAVVLDISQRFTPERSEPVKAALTAVFAGLTPNDFMHLLLVDGSATPRYPPCFTPAEEGSFPLVRATAENVQSLIAFLNDNVTATADAAGNLEGGVLAALQLLNQSGSELARSTCIQVLLVVDMGSQLDTTRSEILASGVQLAVYTFAAPDAETLLTACRSGGLTRYVTPSTARQAIPEYYRLAAARVSIENAQWNSYLGFVPQFSAGWGLVLSASKAVYDRSGSVPRLLGVVGMDVTLTEIYRIVDSVRTGLTYAALITTQGDSLLHPSFQPPFTRTAPPYFVDASLLEVPTFSSDVRKRLLSELVGTYSATVLRNVPNWPQSAGTVLYYGLDLIEVDTTWNWQRLIGLPFVLYSIHATSDLIYHDYESNNAPGFGFEPTYLQTSADYYPDPTLPGLATPTYDPLRSRPPALIKQKFDHLFWKVGPRGYENADHYVANGEKTREFMQEANAFVNEFYVPGARVNPGMKKSLKSVIRAFSSLNSVWVNVSSDPAKKETADSVAAVYLGHDSSYIGLYPGLSGIPTWYDPSQRGWYIRSKGRPQDACFTTPYFDAFGAGVVTSISRAVYSDGHPIAVQGFDFIYPNVAKIVLQNTGCALPNRPGAKCMVISNAGLLVLADVYYNASYVEAVDSGAISALNLFLGSAEPELAQQLVQIGFLQQLENPSWFAGITSYVFNTDEAVLEASSGILEGVLFADSSSCTTGEWSLVRIARTNAFLIAIDKWSLVSDQCSPFVAKDPVPLLLDQCGLYQNPLEHVTLCPSHLSLLDLEVSLEEVRNSFGLECSLAIKELDQVSEGVRIAVTVIAAIFIFFWVIVFVVVVIYRHRPVLRVASMAFSSVIILGGIGLFSTAFTWYPSPMNDSSCLAYLWIWTLSATIAFTPIFIKAWKVYLVARAAQNFRKNVVQDKTLVAMVCLFLVLVSIYLAIWTGVDPYVAVPDYNALDSSSEYIIACDSDNFGVWIGILIGYFALQIAIACVLAFLTRRLSSAFADSRVTVLIVYCIAFAAAILVPLVFLLDFVPDAVYLIRHIGLLVITFLCLGLFFFPKLYVILSGGYGSQVEDSSYVIDKVTGSDHRTRTRTASASSGRMASEIRSPASAATASAL